MCKSRLRVRVGDGVRVRVRVRIRVRVGVVGVNCCGHGSTLVYVCTLSRGSKVLHAQPIVNGHSCLRADTGHGKKWISQPLALP
jgi:hypothetical protein